MKIAIGADPFGVELKETVSQHLAERGHEIVDLGGTLGADRAYYQVADELGRRLSAGEFDRGLLVCGTGMGMAIVANKHRGVYAAPCEDAGAARKARSINNANVLTLGAMLTAPFKAREIVDAFLETEFKSGWDDGVRTFLDQSMKDIAAIEERTTRTGSGRP